MQKTKSRNQRKGTHANKSQDRRQTLIMVGCFLVTPLILRGAFHFRPDIASGVKAAEVELVSPLASPVNFEEAFIPGDEILDYQAETKWEEFEIAVAKVAPMYNFPAKVVLSQGALESAHGRSKFAQTRNNFLGIGAYDSDPNQAFTYENAEQCVIQYMQLIKKNFPEAWAQRDNPDALLHALKVNSKGKMYATDPNYEAKVKSMKEWKGN